MEHAQDNQLVLEFSHAVVDAVEDARKFARISSSALLKAMERDGVLTIVRDHLRTILRRMNPTGPFDSYLTSPCDAYREATLRVGCASRLSVEAFVVDQRWKELFTEEEITAALTELSRIPETPGSNTAYEMDEASESALSVVRLPSRPFDEGAFTVFRLECMKSPECEVMADLSRSIEEARPFELTADIRRHLECCPICAEQNRDLITAIGDLDRGFLKRLQALLGQFERSLDLRDEYVEQFTHFTSEEIERMAGDDEEMRESLEVEQGYEIDQMKRILGWRALRLGVHVGQLMLRFENSFSLPGGGIESGWLRWREGKGPVVPAKVVKQMPEETFQLALLARYLILTRFWPEGDGHLWLPAEPFEVEGPQDKQRFASLPPFLIVDVADASDWLEVLGEEPTEFSPWNLLHLAYKASIGAAARDDQKPAQPVLQELQCLRKEVEKLLERSDVIVDVTSELSGLHQSSDLRSCEEELRAKIGNLYPKLSPQARGYLIQTVQELRIRNPSVGGRPIGAAATAFELESRGTVVSGLVDHLHQEKINYLPSQSSTVPSGQPQRPVFTKYTKAERMGLNDMKELVAYNHDAIADFFDRWHLDPGKIVEAIEKVRPDRNASSHGGSIDPGKARLLLEEWLKPAGVFSVLFPSEQD